MAYHKSHIENSAERQDAAQPARSRDNCPPSRLFPLYFRDAAEQIFSRFSEKKRKQRGSMASRYPGFFAVTTAAMLGTSTAWVTFVNPADSRSSLISLYV